MVSSTNDDSTNQRNVFATTSWSVVLNAGDSSSSAANLAIATLCETYWLPLYTFARRKGQSRSAAEDLTQAFFAEFLQKEGYRSADQSRGRFRTFLLSCFDNFIKNQWRADQAKKRGGGKPVFSFDFDSAESSYANAPVDSMTAERVFERSWALAAMEEALKNLRLQYQQAGNEKLFAAIERYLTGGTDLPYADVGQQLGIREGAVKVAVHRLRQRYGQQLRLQIAATVKNSEEVEDELRSLFDALGG
jgi:RNA polymerase sigma-70 factor (ECF subfamily)